ncbi:hypothetical protein FOA52_007811 [Chlamydomonas sp. UWO 241]|nr:hypothetical protein FOA52_007811 [Chlamydomonas sp. UWO 241]
MKQSRLHPLPGGAGRPGQAAMVVICPKPRQRWLRADYNFYAAEMDKVDPDDRRAVAEPWLVGVWDTMQLDPCAWGIPAVAGIGQDTVSFLKMTVRASRLHLRFTTAASEDMGFVLEVEEPGGGHGG